MKALALWNSHFESPFFDTTNEAGFTPPVDIEENDSQFVLSFDVPGIAKDDVKIEIHDKRLTVSGERKWESKSQDKSKYSIERSYGRFERSFSLPSTVDSEKVEARYENGVLRLSLPKVELAKPRQIRIV